MYFDFNHVTTFPNYFSKGLQQTLKNDVVDDDLNSHATTKLR